MQEPTLTFAEIISGARLIPLTKGELAIVDAEDCGILRRYKWVSFAKGYAARKIREAGSKGIEYMHRLIMGAKPGEQVDHANGNRVDNRRQNLRICTQSQNSMNAKLRVDNTSGVKGVRWHRQRQKWNARIQVNGAEKSLGMFRNLSDAATAREAAAKQLHGEFARTT